MELYKNLSLDNLLIALKEEWKDIEGYEGLYAVSSFGRVRSYSRMVWTDLNQKYSKRRERILRQKIHRDGYLMVTLCKDKGRRYRQVHILVANAFIPNPENKPQVNHKKGNKKDNRVPELEWTTAKENSNHAISIGVDSVRGEHNWKAKLTEDQVKEIRESYSNVSRPFKYANAELLSERYGVTASVIKKIAYRALWKHVK